jgi:hypothetical protein
MGWWRRAESVIAAAALAWGIGGCTGEPAPAAAPAPVRHEVKPGAPVDVQLDARALPDGDHEVTLRATPLVDADALELRVGTRRQGTGRVAAGETRTLSVRVPADAASVVGGATVMRGGARLGRGTTLHLGAKAAYVAPVPARVVTLPGGARVAEVRQ